MPLTLNQLEPHLFKAASLRSCRLCGRVRVYPARAVKFAILTACWPGEVRGARRSEFDTVGKLWTIPAERKKAKR